MIDKYMYNHNDLFCKYIYTKILKQFDNNKKD